MDPGIQSAQAAHQNPEASPCRSSHRRKIERGRSKRPAQRRRTKSRGCDSYMARSAVRIAGDSECAGLRGSSRSTGGTLEDEGHRPRDRPHRLVESEDRRVVAIEVKLAATVGDSDVRHLNWLAKKVGDRLVNRVVITTGESAYRRPDGVAVIPLALLGP